jgi:acrylyl-CoA reductase (NADPH)
VSFRALVLEDAEDGLRSTLQDLDADRLPDGDVTVRIDYSSVNYKDAMVLRGLGRLVRTYPHVPGIDLAGTVEHSDADGFVPGDRVVLTGWRVGEASWGGYSELARVRAEWLVRLPGSMSTRDAMSIGTAGLTAMLAVHALEGHGLDASNGPVLVTGGAGGVGSFAVHVLARSGYEVVASTGRPETVDYLRTLGATEIVDRGELESPPERPLLSTRWAGCVDAVGGTTLGHVLAEMDYGAAVAACGNAAGNDLSTTVLPFILRSVNLLGIDSVALPRPVREELWARLADVVDQAMLDAVVTEVALREVDGVADDVLAGRVRGRLLVDVNG